jgi:hypothetical protein
VFSVVWVSGGLLWIFFSTEQKHIPINQKSSLKPALAMFFLFLISMFFLNFLTLPIFRFTYPENILQEEIQFSDRETFLNTVSDVLSEHGIKYRRTKDGEIFICLPKALNTQWKNAIIKNATLKNKYRNSGGEMGNR